MRKVTAYTSPNWAEQHSELNSPGKSHWLTAMWSSNWEMSWVMCWHHDRLQIAVWGTHAYNPRLKAGIVISLYAKCSGFFKKLLQCYLFHLVSCRILLAPGRLDRPLGAQEFKTHSLSLLKCCLTCCACMQAWNLSPETCFPASEAWTRLHCI